MIILDTNALSELMKIDPDPTVRAWFSRQERLNLFITSITEAEIWQGIELLPDGRRRRLLEQAAITMIARDFSGRTLGFDSRAAESYGKLAAELRKAGRSIGMADIQIAAIARVHGFAVATRNTRHFTDCGIELIDPFTATAGR
ncbi:MAG: type II toxin-antitoxin system VapC family toxin [Thermohalobaculum sp.]